MICCLTEIGNGNGNISNPNCRGVIYNCTAHTVAIIDKHTEQLLSYIGDMKSTILEAVKECCVATHVIAASFFLTRQELFF